MIYYITESQVALNEYQTFKFFSKFKRDPELREYANLIDKADTMLAGNNIDSKINALKAIEIALRILSNIGEILSVGYAIADTTIAPGFIKTFSIPGYLCIRALTYLVRIGEDESVNAQAKKVIIAYEKAINSTDDEKAKKELTKIRDELISEMDRYKSNPNGVFVFKFTLGNKKKEK